MVTVHCLYSPDSQRVQGRSHSLPSLCLMYFIPGLYYVIWPLNSSINKVLSVPFIKFLMEAKKWWTSTLTGGNIQWSDYIKNKLSNKAHQMERGGSECELPQTVWESGYGSTAMCVFLSMIPHKYHNVCWKPKKNVCSDVHEIKQYIHKTSV